MSKIVFYPKQELKSYSLAEAYEKLKQYHLSDSLHLIGQVNAAYRLGLELSLVNVVEPVKSWMQTFEGDQKTKLQVLLNSTRLARYLLLSGANDDRTKVLRLEDDSFPRALDIAGAVYDGPLEKILAAEAKDLIANTLGRLSWQFFLQENSWVNMSRAYLLFIELPKMFPAYDVSGKMLEYYGITSLSFLVTGFALWLKCDGSVKYDLSVEIKELQDFVNQKSQLCFLEVSSGTPEQYRRATRGDDWKTANKLLDIYFLDAFSRFPAIKVKKSLGTSLEGFVVPQPKYFIERAAGGIFHLLAEREQQLGESLGKKYYNPFRVYFGEIYREYVGIHLGQGIRCAFVDLDNDFISDNRDKKPDFAVIDGKVCILFEVKTSLLTLPVRMYYNEKQMRDAVMAGSFEKAVEQLNRFKNRILSGTTGDNRFDRVEQVISVLVGYEDIAIINPYLLPMLEAHYGEFCEDFQLGTISDIEKIGGVLSEDLPFGEIMAEKVTDKSKKYFPLLNFLKDYFDGRNKLLVDAGNRLTTLLTGD